MPPSKLSCSTSGATRRSRGASLSVLPAAELGRSAAELGRSAAVMGGSAVVVGRAAVVVAVVGLAALCGPLTACGAGSSPPVAPQPPVTGAVGCLSSPTSAVGASSGAASGTTESSDCATGPAGPPAPSPRPAPNARDPRWAVPLFAAGLPNLHRVAEGLYRGAQPEAVGFAHLRALGIKTIVNLRSAHSDISLIESSGVPTAAFQYVELPMNAWDVDEAELLAFLRIATDPARGPVFVHCQHGADRTGAAVASYRIAVEGWSAADAAREMTDGGFGYHALWSNLVRTVKRLDAQRLRGKLAGPER